MRPSQTHDFFYGYASEIVVLNTTIITISSVDSINDYYGTDTICYIIIIYEISRRYRSNWFNMEIIMNIYGIVVLCFGTYIWEWWMVLDYCVQHGTFTQRWHPNRLFHIKVFLSLPYTGGSVCFRCLPLKIFHIQYDKIHNIFETIFNIYEAQWWFECWNLNSPRQLYQHHCWWGHGTLHLQVINIICARWTGPCFPRGRLSTTWAISVLRNDELGQK